MENWKQIELIKGYEISDLGKVRSLKMKQPKLMTPKMNKDRYFNIGLTVNGKRKYYYIHQLVAMAFLDHKPNGLFNVVDHINNIKTDNRLCNLRVITMRENTSRKHIESTSKFVGVHLYAPYNKWCARIRYKGKKHHLGYFTDELEASKAYNTALELINKGEFKN